MGLSFSPAGPEYKSMKSCIYIGMASDDVDISQLVETIAVTAREIEENSRVCMTNQGLIPFPSFAQKQAGAMKDKAALTDVCLSILSQEVLNASCELGVVPASGMPRGSDRVPAFRDPTDQWRRGGALTHMAQRGGLLWLEGGGNQAFRKAHLLFDKVCRDFLGEAGSQAE